MTMAVAYHAARIFDGDHWHEGSALLVDGRQVRAIVPAGTVPADAARIDLAGGMLVPGFIDLQVNGGGGVLIGAGTTAEDIRAVCAAHARFGTTGLLPTLITDTPAVTQAVIDAGAAAVAGEVPGFLGLHLEGPHLSVARKGAHDPALIRPMEQADLERLLAANEVLPNLLTTLAPENASLAQIATLAAAGIVVSLGHTDTTFDVAMAAAEAGAGMATHLFNAMSQIGNREPGMAGAALRAGRFYAGLIADGIHVHPETIALAVAAKQRPGKIFVVTDAMAPAGTEATSFTLNGRTILRADGALRLADGTLAGADLTMIDAVAFMHRRIGLPLEEALRMASLYPAEALDITGRHGHLRPGAFADFLHLSEGLTVEATWINGTQVFG